MSFMNEILCYIFAVCIFDDQFDDLLKFNTWKRNKYAKINSLKEPLSYILLFIPFVLFVLSHLEL